MHDIMADAVEAWRELERVSGFSLLDLCGGLTIGAPDSRYVRPLVAQMEAEGVSPQLVTAARMAERYPQHRLADDDVVVWNPESGLIRPEHAIVAALVTAQQLGARVLEHCAVTGIGPEM